MAVHAFADSNDLDHMDEMRSHTHYLLKLNYLRNVFWLISANKQDECGIG
jgi:hypothetical protein